jgi:hypothetical protein
MSSYPPPKSILPIFNSSNYTFSALGLTESQADLLYVRLNAASQSINGSLGVSNLLTAGTFSAPSNTGTTPVYSFNGHSDTGIACITTVPAQARVEHYVNGGMRLSYDQSNFISNLVFRANQQRFVSAAAGMKYENTTTGSLFFNTETPLLFRETDIELTKPLILPASTAATNTSAPYTVLFQNQFTPPTAGSLFGIKARVSAATFPSLSFFLNDTEVMGFDRSNMIVSQTFRCDAIRMRSTDAGMRYVGIVDTVPTVGFYYSTMSGFLYSAISSNMYFQTLCPLRVSLGDTSVNNQLGTPLSGTDITIIRRLTPQTITNAGNGTATFNIGITLPNTNYDVFPTLQRTSGTEGWSIFVISKSTTQVVLEYAHKSSGSTTDTIVIGGMIYGYP